MGRRWGKTVLGEVLCTTFAARGGHVAWVVPTYKNGRPLWRMLRRTLAPLKAAGLVRINEAERTVEFDTSIGGGFLGMYTGEDNADSMRGEAFDLVIVDEAAKLGETAWTDAILPTLADRNGRAMLISTPFGRNWFWRWWMMGQNVEQQNVRSFTAPTSANPNPRIQRAAELARERVSDRTYRQEWLAEFVDDAGGVFTGVRQVLKPYKLFERHWHPGTGSFAIGVDLAKTQDFTVVVLLDLVGNRVVGFERWNRESWPLQKARIAALALEWGNPRMYIDATGLGDPIYDDLARAGLNVEAVKLTAPAKEALIENAVLLVEQQAVSIPDPTVEPRTAVLVSELEAYEYGERSPSGRQSMAAPAGMHDDCVIAFALACWALSTTVGGVSGLPDEVLDLLLSPVPGQEWSMPGSSATGGFGGATFLDRKL